MTLSITPDTILLNKYKVVRQIGRGGMAEVYQVWDTQRGVNLAMKVLREDLAEDRIFMRRFEREAHNLTRLQHPNIVRCYGLEVEGHHAFMLMDYIEGTTLRREIFDANGPMSMERINSILTPVCSALNYAHQMGMVHCDVKSANIMIHKNGTVYLTDFGIARGMDSATSTMVGIGTPAYMAPELIKGQDPTPQTDIYALGVMLYEMLTGGERPFTGERAEVTGTTAEKVRWEHLKMDPILVTQFNPKVPVQVEAAILKCLQKNPAKRFASALDLLAAVQKPDHAALIVKAPKSAPVSVFREPVLRGPKQDVPSAASENEIINNVKNEEDKKPEVSKPDKYPKPPCLSCSLAFGAAIIIALIITYIFVNNRSQQIQQIQEIARELGTAISPVSAKAEETKNAHATEIAQLASARIQNMQATATLAYQTIKTTSPQIRLAVINQGNIANLQEISRENSSDGIDYLTFHDGNANDVNNYSSFEIPEGERGEGRLENGKYLITTRSYSSVKDYIKFKIWDLEEGKNICNSPELYGIHDIFLMDENKYIITFRLDYVPNKATLVLWDASKCRKLDSVELIPIDTSPHFSGETFFLENYHNLNLLKIFDGSFHFVNPTNLGLDDEYFHSPVFSIKSPDNDLEIVRFNNNLEIRDYKTFSLIDKITIEDEITAVAIDLSQTMIAVRTNGGDVIYFGVPE